MNERKQVRPETIAGSSPPLRIAFDPSCNATIRQVLTQSAAHFIETDPASADLVIFDTDEIKSLDANPTYRAWRDKSICITESDIPTFMLPGLYAANQRGALTQSRTRTMTYFISERERGNPEVRRLIGQPVEKTYLYSFMGGSNSWARKRLFRHVQSAVDTVVEATDSYNHWSADQGAEAKKNQQRKYAAVMAASKFALCPRGCGLSSYRLFESMSLGIAPVVIADKWRPIDGVDWSFAIFVPERNIPNLDRIVRARRDEWRDRGQAAAAAYKRHFAPENLPVTLHRDLAALAHAMSAGRESLLRPAARARAAGREVYWALYDLAKHVVLRGYKLAGRPLPIKLHQPIDEQIARGFRK